MQIIQFSKELKNLEPSIVTIGKFESFHLGHQTVLQRASIIAKEKNYKLIVFVVIENQKVLAKNEGFVFPFELRKDFFNEYKVDKLIIFQDTIENYAITTQQFVDFLKTNLNVKAFVCAKNFKIHEKHIDQEIFTNNFSSEILNLEKFNNQIISTSLIKTMLIAGEVLQVKNLLQFYWFYSGIVVHGKKIATNLLKIKTINVEPIKTTFIPRLGIYFSSIKFDNKKYYGVTSISTNPTIDDSKDIKYETLIFDFNQSLYEKKVYISLIDFIREPIKFDNLEDLRKKIDEDVKYCKNKFKHLLIDGIK